MPPGRGRIAAIEPRAGPTLEGLRPRCDDPPPVRPTAPKLHLTLGGRRAEAGCRLVSVIIPTLDEEGYLPACLDALLPQSSRLGAEVIVVDGGSRDATCAIARCREGVRLLREARRGRASQLNAGARRSAGSLLVFLHADTILPPTSLRRLDEADRRGEPEAGGFSLRFDGRGPLLACTARLHNLRARLTGVVYGDQVPFVRRERFYELGGFREGHDLEDLEFGARLRRLVAVHLLPLTVTTSARRFRRAGALRAIGEAAWILACWSLRRRVARSDTFFSPVR